MDWKKLPGSRWLMELFVIESPRNSQVSFVPWLADTASICQEASVLPGDPLPAVTRMRIQFAPFRSRTYWPASYRFPATLLSDVQPPAGGLPPPGAEFTSIVKPSGSLYA